MIKFFEKHLGAIIVFIFIAYAFGIVATDLNKQIDKLEKELGDKAQSIEQLQGDYLNVLDEYWTLSDLLIEYMAEVERLEQENLDLREKVNRLELEIDNLIILDVSATHYTAFCDTGCRGKTRTGYDVSDTIYYNGMRIVAVDPNIIPLGTTMTIHTAYDKFKAIALDTGGLIKGNKIDILVSDSQEAKRKGIVEAKVVMQNGG